MDKDQAIKVAEALESSQRARLEQARQRRARPPSFLFAVAGFSDLPPSEQEDLYTEAKWATIKNRRFLVVAGTILAIEITLLWWPLQKHNFLLLFAYFTLPGGVLMALAAIPFIRAKLRSLLRAREKAA